MKPLLRRKKHVSRTREQNVTCVVRAESFTQRIQGMARPLPLCNLQTLLGRLRACVRACVPTGLTQPCSACCQGTFGGQGRGWAATRENEHYRWGTLFPSAHAVICLICRWVEVGRREGSVQQRAMRSSEHQAFLTDHWPQLSSCLDSQGLYHRFSSISNYDLTVR